ncbi:MAG: TonB-dependent receptor, partial [Myxococcales bacterium]|nr:TonB-dependent receptor [Myxococcales bacterium]
MGDAVVTTYRVDTNTEATQLAIRSRSAGVRDAVSAQEIRRAGDSSAASAVRRVVATTIVGGQYLYVRGLGGRYTNILLNRALLPQLDLDAAGVQLDLFPTALLSGISVLKSYTPDLPGAFGGGTALLTTADPPEEFTVRASLGLGYNSATTWRTAPRYRGGRFDLLGFDDGTRALPRDLRDTQLDRSSVPDAAERTRLSQQFEDDFQLQHQNVGLAPLQSLGLSAGGNIDLPGDRRLMLGATLGWTLDRQRNYERGGTPTIDARDPETNEVTSYRYQDELRRRSYEQTARLFAMGSAQLDLGDDHTIGFVSLFNQIGEDFTAVDTGRIDEEAEAYGPSLRMRYRWVQRTIWFNQLRGSHYLGDVKLSWHAYTTRARRYEPDTRDTGYRPGDPDRAAWPSNAWGSQYNYQWDDRVSSTGQRLFLDLDGNDYGGGADLEYDWRQADRFKLMAGVFVHTSVRENRIRRFRYLARSGASNDALYETPEVFFSADNATDVWRMEETTASNDSFDSRDDTLAVYAATQLRLFGRLRLYGGARIEAFRQQLTPGVAFADPAEDLTEERVFRTNIDVLPSATATLELTEAMNLRAGYAVSVARPSAREISGAVFPDYVRRRIIFGAPDVQRTRIQHVDLRWEWFPGTNQVLAATAFAKFFEDPIELVILNRNRLVSFQNTKSARNVGFELEARTGLGAMHDSLEALRVGANFTWVDSQVTLTETQQSVATNNRRPLSYQAPWTVSANVGYDPEGGRYRVYLFYKVDGPSLTEVGSAELPDVYLQPIHQLDLAAFFDVTENVQLRLNVKNMLHSRTVERGGGVVMRSYQDGVDASLTLSWNLR